MRKCLIITLFFNCLFSYGLNIDKETTDALNCIKLGYVKYGFEEMKKIAAKNVVAAQFYVAVCYEHGIGVEKNIEESFKMYRKAAERGLPDAMFQIASFYRDGKAVVQDKTREAEWLQRFSQKGGQNLLPDLIMLYNEGLKNPNNYALNPKNNNGGSSLMAQSDGIIQKQTISAHEKPTQTPRPQLQPIQPQSVVKEEKADVDINIPENHQKQKNMFALIIANENYQDEENVENAINDGIIFSDYCEKTIGVPHDNVKLVKNATLNNIKRHLNWLTQVMDVYQGEASIIFYYAGHGIPDESNRSAYLLPVDGFGSDVSTGYSLDQLYTDLSSKPAKSVIVLLDACFSGTKRDGGMLASARGVAIKAKQNAPKGKMVVFSAAQGDETAYPYKEKRHGMFTYYLLKKLQVSKGNVSLGELSDYVISEVKKQSIVTNSKIQTPLASPSESATDWRSWKLR